MAVTMACIAGEEIPRQLRARQLSGQSLGSRDTPFGPSGEILHVRGDKAEYYLLARYGPGMGKTCPHEVNYRANLYALKDLGVERVLAYGAGGAISHSLRVGDLVVPSDLVDQTYLRPKTFFDRSPLGYLRQYPVFCPSLSAAVAKVLGELNLPHRKTGILAVREGPRHETPAEVRMLATIGAEVVTHSFVPELFLARELQMRYAAICYVVGYAETGSTHRPYAPGNLFGGLSENTSAERLVQSLSAMGRLLETVAQTTVEPDGAFTAPMAEAIRRYHLGDDWRSWFAPEDAPAEP